MTTDVARVSRAPRRILAMLAIVIVAAGIAVFSIAWRPSISAITAPARESFATADISRGAELSALGDCVVCHTTRNGRPFAGGRGVQTPFGTVFSTNITPDSETGIGRWSLPAFRRAMRDGIDREGGHLYPVLPYPHFIHATDDDLAALYAFLMTRRPVAQEPRRNELGFPFNVRTLLAGWNLLFLRHDPWRPDEARTPEWNRGAYLVEAIGHCGACHTPHNLLGAEKPAQTLAGGEAEGWDAPALRTGTAAPAEWTVDALTSYLRTGFDSGHGAASGPMTEVTQQLAAVPDADVRAMAVYIGSFMPDAAPAITPPRPAPDPSAAAIFAGACGACHAADAPMSRRGAPSLALSTAVHTATARDVVAVILHGLPWREGHSGPYMPAFAGALTDAQVASVAAYVRANFSDQPAWTDVEATVRDAKRQGDGS